MTFEHLEEFFAVLEDGGPGPTRYIRLRESLPDVVRHWESATRVSPIYRWIGGNRPERAPAEYFAGDCELLFLLFAQPSFIQERLPPEVDAWLSFGSHNVLVFDEGPSSTRIRELREWADAEGLGGEHWFIRDHEVVNTEPFTRAVPDLLWREGLADLMARHVSETVDEVRSEFGPLFASTMARAQFAMPEVIGPLWKSFLFIKSALERVPPDTGIGRTIQVLHDMVTANAGLSRFSSQAFSGTSPILQTECHYWTHSLLGTGVANRALWRVTDFLNSRVHDQQFFARVAAYADRPMTEGRLESLESDHAIWRSRPLDLVTVGAPEAYLPLVGFFSGRDGFNVTPTTVSAPLATVAACNAEQWTLRTCTHELCHMAVRQVLALLRTPLNPPSPADGTLHRIWCTTWQLPLGKPDDAAEDAAIAVERLFDIEPPTLLAALQRYFFLTVLDLQRTEEETPPGEKIRESTEYKTVQRAMHMWSREVEELMVHAFDFLWFYGSKRADQYVRSIWQSWSVIPSIQMRVPEYVLRTLTAMQVIVLKKQQDSGITAYPADCQPSEHPIMIEARDAVLGALEPLRTKPECGEFVVDAIQYISDYWPHLSQQMRARQGLVRLVLSFLYSEERAIELRRTDFAGSESGAGKAYAMKFPSLEGQGIDNPLHFITTMTASSRADAARSLWLWHMLAFYSSPPREQ